MSERCLITPSTLEALMSALLRDGVRLIAPRSIDGRIELGEIRAPGEAALEPVQTIGSAKPLVFPSVEKILGYRGAGAAVELVDPMPAGRPTVLFGIRPCDARAFGSLGAILNWDTRDRFFEARMNALTVVTIACTRADDACFCTSVGGGPGDPAGSDVLLRPLAGGGHVAEVLSEKGRAFVALVGGGEPLPASAVEEPLATLEPAFERAQVASALERGFESPAWEDQARRCLGCGTCAYVCPTCACFDIQDERETGGGRRLRCWDSCGLRQFTLHASGHNPREQQHQRWRQRVYHKFVYMPARFSVGGCVGCGRCTRACPVDMNLKEHLVTVAEGA